MIDLRDGSDDEEEQPSEYRVYVTVIVNAYNQALASGASDADARAAAVSTVWAAANQQPQPHEGGTSPVTFDDGWTEAEVETAFLATGATGDGTVGSPSAFLQHLTDQLVQAGYAILGRAVPTGWVEAEDLSVAALTPVFEAARQGYSGGMTPIFTVAHLTAFIDALPTA